MSKNSTHCYLDFLFIIISQESVAPLYSRHNYSNSNSGLFFAVIGIIAIVLMLLFCLMAYVFE